MRLRIHSFLPHSRANGPGARAVIWTQGCSLGCPGCFNPELHAFTGGQAVEVDELFDRISDLGDTIEGLTLSGGEPLQQLRPLTALLRRVRRETNLSVMLFTGYSWEELMCLGNREPEALGYVDVVIAGRFDAQQRLARSLRGSANQTVHLLTGRYSLSDLETVPEAEAVIHPDGSVCLSGIDPPQFSEPLVFQ